MDTAVLYGLFVRLREKGIPLGTRDYLDGIQAVWYYRNRFFRLQKVLDNSASARRTSDDVTSCVARHRDALVWLCQTLWARSESEKRTIADVVTEQIQPADNELVFALLERLDTPPEMAGVGSAFDEPQPVHPFQEDQSRKSDSRKEETKPPDSEEIDKAPSVPDERYGGTRRSDTHFGMNPEYGPSRSEDQLRERYDIAMPDAPRFDEVAGASYLFSTTPEISKMWLLSLWRRLFVAEKKLDRHRIDIDKTVLRLGKTGYLSAPVAATRNVNTSSLLVFVDSGKSMSPWKKYEQVFVESLDSKLNGLKRADIYYFNKAPGEHVYRTPDFVDAVSVDTLFAENSTSPVITYSAAGSAENYMEPRISQRVSELYECALRHGIRPLIWLNPMPKSRWIESWIDLSNRFPFVYTSEFKKEPLFRTIDLIRSIRR